jgi:hypothetical protein
MILDEEIEMEENLQAGGMSYSLGPEPLSSVTLTQEMTDAIAKAVEWIDGKTPEELSKQSHEMSWQWRELEPDEEMDVFMELIPEDVISKKRSRVSEICAAVK